jgi:hypothetical protein
MTAVAAPPGDTIVSQPARLKTYAARRSELILVMKPEYPVRGPSGEQVDLTPGIRVAFSAGLLRVPLKGKVTTQQGREIPAAEVLEFLDSHRLNGDRHEGFFEVPQAAPPVSEDEMSQIMLSVAMGDTERLEAVLEAERSGWNRPEIIKGVEQGLSTLRTMAEQFEAQQKVDAKRQARAKG